jgi:hypothetical protein
MKDEIFNFTAKEVSPGFVVIDATGAMMQSWQADNLRDEPMGATTALVKMLGDLAIEHVLSGFTVKLLLVVDDDVDPKRDFGLLCTADPEGNFVAQTLSDGAVVCRIPLSIVRSADFAEVDFGTTG